jgi:hypothetical protein
MNRYPGYFRLNNSVAIRLSRIAVLLGLSFSLTRASLADSTATLRYVFDGYNSGESSGMVTGVTKATLPLTSYHATSPPDPQFSGQGQVSGSINAATGNFMHLVTSEIGSNDINWNNVHQAATLTGSFNDYLNVPDAYASQNVALEFRIHGIFDISSLALDGGLGPWSPNAAATILLNNNTYLQESNRNGSAPSVSTGGTWASTPHVTQLSPSAIEFDGLYQMTVPYIPSSPYHRAWLLQAALSSFVSNGSSSGNMGGTISLVDVLNTSGHSIADQVHFDSGLTVATPEPGALALGCLAAFCGSALAWRRGSAIRKDDRGK